MGRKPNQLILEFFERGQKLEDSSNRYQHTCKACGEKFPKGRIDSLTAHLVKKCPAISLRDRQKALLQLNDLPDLPDARNGQANNPQVELPVGNRNWTALETLAEVSRQIDLSEKHDDRVQHDPSAGSRSEETPRKEHFELQEQWTPDNPPLSYEARVQRDKKLLSQKLAPRRDSAVTLPPVDLNRSASPSEAMAATAKSMAAAASARFVPMLDPQLIGEGLPDIPQSELPLDTAEQTLQRFLAHRPAQENQTWPMLDGSGGNMYPDPDGFIHQSQVNTFQPIAMNQGMTTEFSAEYGNGQKPNKPKVRGRFTPTRRKEVQEVRKRGACIRCRMLKKPCSGDSPCNTCKNVESARLWKQPCIRTRIADELDMYSAGLHAVLAYHEVNAVKSRVTFSPSPYPIEASHYPDTTIYATFNALSGQYVPPEKNIDPSLDLDLDFTGPTVTHRILDNDNDDLPMKVEAYMKRMSSVFFDKESSHFMNVTLNTALELSIQNQDVLLTRVLELWSTVHILVDHELSWAILEKTDASAEAGQGALIDDTATYQLLCMQLNAAVEKKAALISKNVLNDLERRLLLRSSTSAFETFLVAIILLNCVEKSIWLFKSWEQDFLKARWPLDKTPIWYGSQGDRITDMLQMLLRMRGIPPKTYVRDEDGILATDADPAAKEYLEKLYLSHAVVLDKQDHPTFDPADSRCYELRFCSKLLLPTG
ncbi:MAG: hypothetical protein M1818_000879 [Claussenomyces sp. TS43310]|nr:MAG: hypothetical protein M1818_000879 [Claussenomyces sp. TS43310]